jgi:hypothetical protein
MRLFARLRRVPKSIRRADIVAGVVFGVLLIVGIVFAVASVKSDKNTLSAQSGTATPTATATHRNAPPATAPPHSPRALAVTTPAAQPALAPPTTAAPRRTQVAPRSTQPVPPPIRTTAPPPVHTTAPPPTHTVAPLPTHTTAPPPSTCTPTTSSGKCYEPGEFCSQAEHNETGVAGDGKAIKCEDNDGWRWEPA